MKIFCVVHVFYPVFWPGLAACIRNIDEPFDLTITYVDENQGIPEMVLQDFPNAKFVLCENRGFDIWPFLKVMQMTDLRNYTHIIKLHTKRDVVPFFGRPCRFNHCDFTGVRWRNYLQAFLATAQNWNLTKRAFDNPRVGMVADSRLICRRNDTPWKGTRLSFDRAVELLASGSKMPKGFRGRKMQFVAGSMFMARVDALRPLLRYPFSVDAFKPTIRDRSEQLAHIVERALGISVSAAGFIITGFDSKLLFRRLWFDSCDILAGIRRFFFEDVRLPGCRIFKVFRQRVARIVTVRDSPERVIHAQAFKAQKQVSFIIQPNVKGEILEDTKKSIDLQECNGAETIVCENNTIHILNQAIQSALGEFVVVVASGEILKSNFLREVLSTAQESHKAGLFGGLVEIHGTGRTLPTYGFPAEIVANHLPAHLMFRKADWILTGGFEETMPRELAIWDFWLKMIERGRGIVQIPQILSSIQSEPFMDFSLQERKMLASNHKCLYGRFPEAAHHFWEGIE